MVRLEFMRTYPRLSIRRSRQVKCPSEMVWRSASSAQDASAPIQLDLVIIRGTENSPIDVVLQFAIFGRSIRRELGWLAS